MLACMLIAAGSIAHSAPSPCRDQAKGQFIFSTESGEQTAFDRLPGADVSIDRQAFLFMPAGDEANRKIRVGYGHRYSVIDFQGMPVDPSSNGHLHTLYMPIDLSSLLDESWTLQLQPAISISSNLLKDPDEIRGDGLQLNFALARRLAESGDTHWTAGVCGDHRFGAWRVYPTLAWIMEGETLSLRIGYPDNLARVRLGRDWSTGMRLYPDGNRWLVHDDDIADSVYEHEGWRLEGFLDWRFAPHWQAALSAGKILNSNHELLLENGDNFSSDSDEPWQVRLELARRF